MFIGRGVGYPTALEGALKLKEISYIHAEGFPAGELKHGSIALLDPDTPLVAIATASHVYEKVVSNIQEVRARDARVLWWRLRVMRQFGSMPTMCCTCRRRWRRLVHYWRVVPLQLFAYHTAVARGAMWISRGIWRSR